jgi:hypothetical protein
MRIRGIGDCVIAGFGLDLRRAGRQPAILGIGGSVMRFVVRTSGIALALPLAGMWFALSIVPAAAQGCLTDAEIERALGDQVRSGAMLVDSSSLPNRPLCSGLTVAQAIQRMRQQMFPQEAARDAAEHRALVARETPRRRAPVRHSAPRPAAHAAAPSAPAQPAPSKKVQSKSGASASGH